MTHMSMPVQDTPANEAVVPGTGRLDHAAPPSVVVSSTPCPARVALSVLEVVPTTTQFAPATPGAGAGLPGAGLGDGPGEPVDDPPAWVAAVLGWVVAVLAWVVAEKGSPLFPFPELAQETPLR